MKGKCEYYLYCTKDYESLCFENKFIDCPFYRDKREIKEIDFDDLFYQNPLERIIKRLKK